LLSLAVVGTAVLKQMDMMKWMFYTACTMGLVAASRGATDSLLRFLAVVLGFPGLLQVR
jgi:hypothetical protein